MHNLGIVINALVSIRIGRMSFIPYPIPTQ